MIGSLHIDRGYVAGDLVGKVTKRRGRVLCKPWVARNGKLFNKSDFVIDMRRKSIRCPAGEVEYFEPGAVVEFDPEACRRCRLRSRCTMASPEHLLAHLGRKQGRRARHLGVRKNQFDARRAAAVVNLETIQRLLPRQHDY